MPEENDKVGTSQYAHFQLCANYRNDESKFGGEDVGENWDFICQQFETDVDLYVILDSERLHCSARIFRVDAIQYYIDFITGTASKYADFKMMISERFNNRAMQPRINTYLQSLRFYKFSKPGLSPNVSLISLSSVTRN